MCQCSACPSVTALAWSGGSSGGGPGVTPRGCRNSCGRDESIPEPGCRLGQSGGIQPCTWPSIVKIKYELSHHCITSATSLSPNPSASETPWHHLYPAQVLPQANRISLRGGTLLPAATCAGGSEGGCAGRAQGIWDGRVARPLWVLATRASSAHSPVPIRGAAGWGHT